MHVDRVAMLVHIYFNQRALPPMPEMEGAKTLSNVYDKAEEAKAAAVAFKLLVQGPQMSRLQQPLSCT